MLLELSIHISLIVIIFFSIMLFCGFDLSSMLDKLILSTIILAIIYLVSIILINFVFVNKKEVLYTNVNYRFISETKRDILYYLIETKDKEFMFREGELKISMADTDSLVIKTKQPKIKILNMSESVRSNYILNVSNK